MRFSKSKKEVVPKLDTTKIYEKSELAEEKLREKDLEIERLKMKLARKKEGKRQKAS